MRIAMYIFLLLAAGAACSCSTSGRLARRDAQALLSHTPPPLPIRSAEYARTRSSTLFPSK